MRILSLLLILLLGGCATQSPPASFYVLSARAEAVSPASADLLVGVGPVNLADYLDRSQIVRRHTDVQLRMDEFNRWAGDLGKNITTVLAENLSRSLGSAGVLPYPWPSALELDYQVLVDISRFDAEQGGLIVLEAQWQLLSKQPHKLLQVQRSHIETRAVDASHEAQVEAQSQALAELGRIIAAAIRAAAGDG
ncbi:PqiC family protein [Thiolapillus sp.]